MQPMTLISAAVTADSVTSNTANSRVPTRDLDKDAFLKLLVTQLKYQDPTQPMDNKEFIAQMAQFSSLEQMTNVRDGLDVLTQMQITTQALSLVGRTVDLHNPAGGDPVSGKVDEVRFVSGEPRLVVGGKEYALSDVLAIRG